MSFRGCSLLTALTHPLTANVALDIPFEEVLEDTDRFVVGALPVSSVTIPAGLSGVYIVMAQMLVSGGLSGATVDCYIIRHTSGADTIIGESHWETQAILKQQGYCISCIQRMNAGDTVSLQVIDSHGDSTVNDGGNCPSLQLVWVGP